MIENSLYYAVASAFLFGLPFYQRLIKSRLERLVILRTISFSDAREKRKEIEERKANKIDLEKDKGENGVLLAYEVVQYQEQNFFNRKPFTCLLCFTFWLMVCRSLLILFISDFALVDHAPLLGAPLLAEAFSRWFKSLPISI